MRSGARGEVEQGLTAFHRHLNVDTNLGRAAFTDILMLTWGTYFYLRVLTFRPNLEEKTTRFHYKGQLDNIV